MNIITFSRELGSCGDEIASMVAERLGLKLVGPAEVHELAQTCDPEYRDACTLYETEQNPGFFERLFFDRPSYKSLFEALTFEQASRGSAVMVGRGAQIVLHGLPGVFSVAVVAPEKVRVRRLMEKLNCTMGEAESLVRDHASEQMHLIRLVFDRDPVDWDLYDLVISTAHLTVAAASDVVVKAVQGMDRAADQENIQAKLEKLALGKRIETLVRRKLGSGPARNVFVSAEESGVVRITGHVLDKTQKEEVQKIASDYPGIARVEDDLKVIGLTYGL